ncbi:hypothetical protein [uncultured Pelagimonas sp.]|nr:hypothetical protein [uncultured Pelagimonas sp.]
MSTVAVKGTSACCTARDRDTGELARKGGFELGPNCLNTTGWHLVNN